MYYVCKYMCVDTECGKMDRKHCCIRMFYYILSAGMIDNLSSPRLDYVCVTFGAAPRKTSSEKGSCCSLISCADKDSMLF